jgi:CubicO group peptidase (beta-lactamase class C family)
MRKLLPALLLLAACSTASQRDYAPAIDASAAQIRAIVESAKVPGAAVAVTVGDRMVWHEAFGRDTTIHTQFRIGSVTKLLTATALMKLVEQGRVQLDDPVSKYLPDFPHGGITLRQLAGHLGGIRHYGPGEYVNTTHYDSVRASLARFARDPLVAQPGEKYFYSTYGYNVIGAVIEQVTGRSFGDALGSLLLDPLRMRETSWDPALTDRLPAGAALSTARDVARFLMATTDSRLLTTASRETMFTPQSTNDGKPTNVGIGWRVAKDEQGRTFLHHGGQSTAGSAFVLIYPRERIGVAFVAGASGVPFREREALAVAAHFLTARGAGVPPAPAGHLARRR